MGAFAPGSSALFALNGDENSSIVGRRAVFPQIDSLPGSQTEPAGHNRHTERTVGQNRAHMGWHIVAPFCGMLEFRIAVGHATRHESLEIPAHRRIGVLAQYQRGTGMA